ncbi:uncharacterized protein ACWYII_020905 isoform 2-T2 [Salvelinus alpinus]
MTVESCLTDTLQDSQTGHLQKKLEGLYLSVKEETLLLPFDSSQATAILPSKGNLDRLMLMNRLQEKGRILVQEMRHWGSLQRAAGTVAALSLSCKIRAMQWSFQREGRHQEYLPQADSGRRGYLFMTDEGEGHQPPSLGAAWSPDVDPSPSEPIQGNVICLMMC